MSNFRVSLKLRLSPKLMDGVWRHALKKLTPRYRELERYIHTELQSRHEWVKADLESIKKAMKDFDKSYLL